MAVKIRLSRKGKKFQPFYRIIATDTRFPRDGKFLEILGSYDPKTDPPKVTVDTERLKYWLEKGAKMSLTVKSILKNK